MFVGLLSDTPLGGFRRPSKESKRDRRSLRRVRMLSREAGCTVDPADVELPDMAEVDISLTIESWMVQECVRWVDLTGRKVKSRQYEERGRGREKEATGKYAGLQVESRQEGRMQKHPKSSTFGI